MIYLIICGIILVLYIIIAYFISGTIVYLNRQPVPKNPKDYGMDFEPIEFTSEDGVRLKGWLIPGNKQKLVIMTHVGGLTKYGSTVPYKNLTKLYNQEIEFLKTARHLHNNGYWVLMFDFRNHGESGSDPNKGMAGVGLEEYKDVVAALQFIRDREATKTFEVGFVSFCMGANATIIAMSKRPEAFKGVKCLMAIQPISMEVFIRTYMKLMLTPPLALLLMPLVKMFVVLRGAHPLGKMSPKEYAKDIKVPTLYVQAIHDPWTELTDILSFYEATPPPKEFFWIENTKHRFESYSYFQDKPEMMLAWINKWLPVDFFK
jgi:alpha-beta hydrolase superfamily lysophospholipase